MPYVWPVEGGEPIRVIGANVAVPGCVVSEDWISGLSDDEREARGIIWEDDSEDECEAQRAVVIAGVKAEAGARINTRYPAAAQANMNMRATELVDTRFDRDLTPEEETERSALKAAAAWIKSVRTASDDIEAGLPSTVAELRALDIAAHPAWPA